jgi:hypothetical protein
MSELWQLLLSREAPELGGVLELNRVRVTRDAAGLEASFKSSRLLTDSEVNRIRNALAEALPRSKVSVGVSYPALSGGVRESIDSYAPFLIDVISYSQPACRTFLINAEWRIDGDRLIIKTENEPGASYLNAREIPPRLQKIMRDLFDITCEVDITVNTVSMAAIDAESSADILRMFDD